MLTEHGLDAMATAMQTLLNEAMKLERSEFLRASPGERTSERIGHANGFKDKTVRSRLGELALKVPQVRPLPDGEPVSFYPRALERGLRSERALKPRSPRCTCRACVPSERECARQHISAGGRTLSPAWARPRGGARARGRAPAPGWRPQRDSNPCCGLERAES